MLCPVVHTGSSFFSAWVANTGLPTSLNISSALKNSQNKQNKRTKPQTIWTLGSVPVPSTEHHYDTMYTIYKCMVCSCLMCPVQCYPLTAKTTGSNAQTRITKTSPAWFLCQGQWERNQIDLHNLCKLFLNCVCLWHRAQTRRYYHQAQHH